MYLRGGWLATTVLATVINFSTPLAQAEVYKWVDADGRVHFSDQAPADQKADAVALPKVDPAPSATTRNVSETVIRERQDRLSRILREERLEKEQQQAELKKKDAEKKAYCERFKNRMERLEASSQVYSENQDGTVRYWKDEDADRYKSEQRQRFKEECGST